MRVRKLFESRLAVWAATQGLAVAWENVAFTPGTDTYLRAFLLRGTTTSRDLAGANTHRVGVFQINVVAPIGVGSGAVETIGESIAALFPQNLRMVDADLTVIVTSPMAIHSGLPSEDRFTLPVSCRYICDTY